MEFSDIHPGLPYDPALASLLAHHQALERNPQEGPRGLNETCGCRVPKLIESKTNPGNQDIWIARYQFLASFPKIMGSDYIYVLLYIYHLGQIFTPKIRVWHMILWRDNDIREHFASDVALKPLLLLSFEDPIQKMNHDESNSATGAFREPPTRPTLLTIHQSNPSHHPSPSPILRRKCLVFVASSVCDNDFGTVGDLAGSCFFNLWGLWHNFTTSFSWSMYKNLHDLGM